MIDPRFDFSDEMPPEVPTDVERQYTDLEWRERMLHASLMHSTRNMIAPTEEVRIDALLRLFDPDFTDVTWEYEASYVGDLPGKLHEKQLEMLTCPAIHRWLFWGNQTGKTTLGAIECGLLALGRHPLQKAGLIHMPPMTVWASGLTWELWEKILLPELLSWLPPWRIVAAPPPFKQSTRRDLIVLADNGRESRITGKAAQQGAAAYQAARVDLVWLDEEHPEAVYDEMQPRLLRKGGRTIATMTPILGLTWVYTRIYERIQQGQIEPERHVFSHADISDNPSISADRLRELEKELEHNPEQLAARKSGRFVRAQGTVLPWDRNAHTVELTEQRLLILRHRGAWFGGVDLGSWRFAFCFGVSDQEGHFLMVDEYFSQNESASVRAQGIHDILTKWKVPPSIGIPADCADPGGIREVQEALQRIKSPYWIFAIEGELKARQMGVMRFVNMLTRGAFKVRDGMGANMIWKVGQDASKPGRDVMGSRWMYEASHWRYPRMKDDQLQKEDPDDKSADGADMMAASRYLIAKYFPADAPKPEPRKPTQRERLQKELDDLDKQERERAPGARERFGKVLRQ